MNGDIVTTAILTAVGSYVTIWTTIIHPRTKERKRKEADDAERQAERDQELDGIPAVDGMTEGTPRLVVRVKRVEDGLAKVAVGQGLLEQRMDEANGTGRDTKAMVTELYEAYKRTLPPDHAA
jgi:hypothetical protein